MSVRHPGRPVHAFRVQALLAMWLLASVASAATPRAAWHRTLVSGDPDDVAAWGSGEPLPGWQAGAAHAVERWCAARLFRGGLRAGIDSLAAEDDQFAHGLRRFRVRQYWRGVPVLLGEVRVSLSPVGGVRMAAGRFVPALTGDPAPAVVPATARRAAFAATGVNAARWGTETQLVAARIAGADRLLYRVRLRDPASIGDRDVLVDARDCSVALIDTPCAHTVGRVYDLDPRGGLADVALPELLLDGSQLRAGFLEVEQPGEDALVEPDGDFRFTPTDPDTTAFDRVNAYWQGWRYLREHLAPLGYAGPPDSIVIRVHSPLAPYVALTNGRYVSFGDAQAGYNLDPAKARDIICHEMQHAVTYGFGIQPTGLNREALALHEALSDYGAASFTNDPAIGEWAYLQYPNGVTRVDRPAATFNYAHYDQVQYGGVPQGSGWANSMILSGALWDLRGALGPAADSLVLESLEFVPTHPEWKHFADGLLAADQQYHAGRFQPVILSTFEARGILGGAALTVSGPTDVAPGDTARFSVLTTTPLSIHWSVRRYCDGLPCSAALDAGSAASVALVDSTDYQLSVDVVNAWGSPLHADELVNVQPPRVTLQGPTTAVPQDTLQFAALTHGDGPISVQWWYTPASPPNTTASLLGLSPTLRFVATQSFHLEARVSDLLNRDALAATDVALVAADFTGPLQVRPGVTAHYVARGPALAAGLPLRWEVRPWCDGAPCADSWNLVGTGPVLDLAEAHDHDLRLETFTSTGSSTFATRFIDTESPTIAILGPAINDQRDGGLRFFALTQGLSGLAIAWSTFAPTPGAPYVPAGSGPDVVVDRVGPYGLYAVVSDRLGRTSAASVSIDAANVVSLPGGTTPFALRIEGFGRSQQTLEFATPTPGFCRLEMVDIAGRTVARLFAGEHPGGRRAFAIPDHLSSGVYLARVQWQGRSLAKRVVVLR